MSEKLDLVEGNHFKDNSKRNGGRIVRLKQRVNPVGKDILPYWVVKNTLTGKVSTIREDRLVAPRWESADA